jgi:N-carbamoyl-L-amino-acid hydrolase
MEKPATNAAGLDPEQVQPRRVIADLRELAALTGGPDGARRVCWTPDWMAARAWLRGKLADLPCTVEIDAAGNLWATLPGASPAGTAISSGHPSVVVYDKDAGGPVVVVGSHIDSVPHGGWLDGALGVVSALEMLRLCAQRTPPITVRLVDWADEEGARFGRSLFGSSAAAGTLDVEAVRGLRDRDGVALPDALAACEVVLDHAPEASHRLNHIAAYLELHIEQGPVLERSGMAIGPVLGTFGVERHAIRFTGHTSHAGSTPLDMRHDAFLGAARLALEVRESAQRLGGVATVGSVVVEPGIVTAIPGACRITLDQRALDAGVLATMLAEARASAERIAWEEGTTVEWDQLWHIEPIPFHPTLIRFAEQACLEVAGTTRALPSGALHDAAEMARRVPTVMLFTSSHDGVSHSPLEDTPVEHLEMAVKALALLTARTITWAAAGGRERPT